MFDVSSFFARLRPVLLGAATALLGLAAGCTYSHGDPAPACDIPNETITYSGVISPIFEANCRRCHGATVYKTLGSNYDFSNYQGINSYSSERILGCIKHLPTYPAMPFDGGKLSDCDIARIQHWIDAGKPNN